MARAVDPVNHIRRGCHPARIFPELSYSASRWKTREWCSNCNYTLRLQRCIALCPPYIDWCRSSVGRATETPFRGCRTVYTAIGCSEKSVHYSQHSEHWCLAEGMRTARYPTTPWRLSRVSPSPIDLLAFERCEAFNASRRGLTEPDTLEFANASRGSRALTYARKGGFSELLLISSQTWSCVKYYI